MTNIIVTGFEKIGEAIETAAKDVAKVVVKIDKVITLAPQAIQALSALLAAVSKAAADVEAAGGAGGLNIALDETAWTDIKAVWPEIQAFVKSL